MEADQLSRHVPRLNELAAAAGRDPSAIAVAPQFAVHVGRTQEEAVARYRHLLSLR